MMAGGMTVTEDTPPDMLAGSMDLTVVLPDRHSLKMSVERSTPMMDLLVQVTTANKMSPAGFILKPLNDRGPLPYKPSTPIGALDAWTIHVVPKQVNQCPAIKKPLKLLNQPFEQTFRLQVHLPRNQLYVARVSPKTRLSDILLQVCSEKNLDPLKYSLRHPINLDQVLSLQYTLGDYKLQELALVCNKTRPLEVSSVDIMSLQRETTNPAYRNTKCEGSVSSGSLEGRSLSPVPSDESSASPPPLPLPPSRPVRKRRPAPKPPTLVQKSVINENQVNGITPKTVINHSRNSSDSSGYHEASVLSESPQNHSVDAPRRSEAPPTGLLSQSMSDVSTVAPPQTTLQSSMSCNSISSLTSNTGSATGRKKKSAPPPPPVVKDGAMTMRSPSVSSTASSTTTLDGNEANAAVKSATLPLTRLNTTLLPPPPPVTPPPTPATPPVAVDEPPITPRVAPPVPRPRSKLLSESDETAPKKPPASPKKAPAPQPKPRKALQPATHTVETSDETKENLEKDKSKKQKHSFMSKFLPSSLFTSHKACVEEMTFKFDNGSIKHDTNQNEADEERTVDNRSPNHTAEAQSRVEDTCANNKIAGAETKVEDLSVNENVAESESRNEDSSANQNIAETKGRVEDASESLCHETLATAGGPRSTIDDVREATSEPDGEISSPVVGTNTDADADLRLADEEIDRIFSNATENHTSPENEEEEATPMMSLPSPVVGMEETEPQTPSSEDQLDWEYRLPAPPTFRDETKSPSVTEFGTVTIGNLSDVVCSKTVKEEVASNLSDIVCSKTVKEELISETVAESVSVEDEEVKNDFEVFKKPSEVPSKVNRNNNFDDPIMRPLRKELRSSSTSSIYETELWKSSRSSIHSVEQEVINELSSTLNQRPNRIDIGEVEAKQSKVDISSRSTLDNFTITTYKDTKPLGVFEDDSIKSSTGEKRDKSKDDAVFRAPKARVKEPNLSRTSSFSVETNGGPVIKRSVSYVSLLAANMPRHSQSYRAALQRHRSSVGPELDGWPRLRKTSSEVNIDKQDEAKENLWEDDSTGLQSVQVLRNILFRSHANLSSSIEETDSLDLQPRKSPIPDEEVTRHNSMSSWDRTQSEEVNNKWKTPKPTLEHSSSLGEESAKPSYVAKGPPSINLSTWSERPKRQVSIKNDGEYISGFGKKPTGQDSSTITENKEEANSVPKTISSPPKKEIALLPIKNEGYKLEGKSKSISDLSRIPIVRSVELKKPFVAQNYDQTRLKHVEMRENTTIKVNPETEDVSKQNGEEGFIGVDSLARRFGVPQKRPVSEYFGTLKYKELQSLGTSSIGNKSISDGPTVVNVSSTTNNFSNDSNEIDSRSSNIGSTLEVKAQAKIRSGGFVGNPPALKRTVSQPSQINSLALREPPQTTSINLPNSSKPSNVTSVSISSNGDQKVPSSSIYIKQSQTLDRKFPNLQPVVKGFKVPADVNSNVSQAVNSSTLSKELNSSNSWGHKSSYNRTFSTPSVSVKSANVKETSRDNQVNNVRLRSSSSSSISQAMAEVAGSIPPPPPMMPVLKPVGERKGVKFLPPPTADPRDLLMESIRSFGKDSLKKVSSGTKSSNLESKTYP